MTFATGENVGAYRIIEQLGRGGMATVFKAYHAALDRFVAIKVLHPAFKQDPNFLARFTREAQIVAKLIHSNIVSVYDFSEHEGMSYLVMRYIEGQTLKARLTGKPLPVPEILDIMRPVGEALTYAHEQGILHRDIKPSNVLLTPDGGVFLTDFGLAKIAQSGDSTLSKDMMVGTPQYISPEQARGESDLDARTDVYSLGVVLFEMLTGRVPFSADTPYAVIHDHIFSPLPLPTSINPDIAPELERVVLKALAKERDDRYQTVGEMTAALEKAVSGWQEARPGPAALAAEPVEATPPPAEAAVATPKKKRRLKRWHWIVLGGAGLLLCFCCFLAAINSEQQKKQPGKGKLSPTGVAPTAAVTPAPPTAVAPTAAVTRVPPTAVAPTTAVTPAAPTAAPSNAVAQAQATVEADPNNPLAHVRLAEALLEAGQPEKAAAEYMEAGDIVAKQGVLDKAADAYEEAARLAPRNVEAHVKAGIAQLRQGETDAAARHFQAAIELRPGAALPHAGLGVSYLVAGQLDDGYQELQEALRRDADSPEAHFGMGLYYREMGKTEEARREFRFVLDSEAGEWLKVEAKEELSDL